MHIADTLSRASLSKPTKARTQEWDVFHIELASMDLKPTALTSDPVLKALLEIVVRGWPPERSAITGVTETKFRPMMESWSRHIR